MAAKKNVFDTILVQGVRAGMIPARTKAARAWFRNTAAKAKRVTESRILSDETRVVSQIDVGNMYIFGYDPKHKETLPYYDTLPLIFPFKKVKDGFLGINMHYLPLPLRAKLMDALYTLASDTRYDEKTKLKMSYELLQGLSNSRYIKPCVKHYLSSHVRSHFIKIHSTEWDIALHLPIAQFKKASESYVHRQSRIKVAS